MNTMTFYVQVTSGPNIGQIGYGCATDASILGCSDLTNTAQDGTVTNFTECICDKDA